MRNLDFRGRVIETDSAAYGRFVYGDFCTFPDGQTAIDVVVGDGFKEYIVDPESVEQSTGCVDRNGTTLYEGDRVILTDFPSAGLCQIGFSRGAFVARSTLYYPGDHEYLLYDIPAERIERVD